MKKIITFILIIAIASVPVFASFEKGSILIGSKNATIVTVPAKQGLKTFVSLADNAVTRDVSFASHIDMAENSLGIKPTISVNGTYFNAYYDTSKAYSYPDNCAKISQTIVSGGKVVIGGGDGYYGTLGFTKDGKALIDQVQIKPYFELDGKSYYFWGVNNVFNNDYVVALYTPEVYYPVQLPFCCKVLTIIDDKITKIEDCSSFTVAANEQKIIFGYSIWENAITWNDKFVEGSSVSFLNEITSKSGNEDEWQNIETAIAANPWLLSDGVNVVSQNKITEAKLGPDFSAQRTFAAIDGSGNLSFGVVTASPNQLASSLSAAGYKDALCLDGGASSALSTSDGTIVSAGRKLSNVLHILSAEDAAVINDPNYVKLPFTDVALTAYYRDAVKWAYTNKITTGKSASAFAPAASCTRGEVATFLWRACGSPEPNTFDDPFMDVNSSDYFYKPVLWAVENGITTGTSALTFNPEATCSNAHIITFIYRAMGEPGKSVNPVSWYSDALNWAESNKLLEGSYLGSFNVNAQCPRCNVVEYLYRYSEK